MATTDETMIRQEITVIRALADGLHEFLSGLSDADLGRQSACDAWTVRDVAGHLANRAERQIASMTRGRSGDASPPPGFTRPADNMAMSAANAAADIAYSQELGDALLPTFRQHYAALAALLDGFSGDEWQANCWHPRRGTMTAREYVSQRIQELAVHDWDIRSAFDPDAALHPDAIPTLLGMSERWLRAAYNPGDHPLESTKRFWFRIYDAEDIHVAIGPEGLAITTGQYSYSADANLDLVVDCHANGYLLLVYGRLDLSDPALYGTKLWLAGDTPLLSCFAQWTAGF